LFFSFLIHPATAKIIHVAGDATGSGDGSSWQDAFTTLAAGLAASASGDEIWVKSATYPEAIRLTTGVRLYGGFAGVESERDGRDWASHPTVIDATGLGKSAVRGANNAILDGFRITGGSADKGGRQGISFWHRGRQERPRFRSCEISPRAHVL